MNKPRKSKTTPASAPAKPASELMLYQTEDNRTRIEVRLENETVWLTQAQMADLFQRERSVITKHIRNIFEEGELVEQAVCATYAQTAADGKSYQTVAYNLDWIAKLDDFLRLSDREILTHAGKVSHEAALAKAEAEYEKFRVLEAAKPSPVEKHFQEAVEQVKQLSEKKPRKKES